MGPKLLSPPQSGPSTPDPAPPQKPPDPTDGLKSNWTPRNPSSELTRPQHPSNPPPVDLQESLLDFTANASYEDQDHVFVQALPHIFQRNQGNWNAKLPEVDLDDGQAVVLSGQVSSGTSDRQDKTEKEKQRGATSEQKQANTDPKCIALKLNWAPDRTANKRKLIFTSTETDHSAYDNEVQRVKTQVPSYEVQNGGISNGKAPDREGSVDKQPKPEYFSLRNGTHEHDVPRRVLWQHSVFPSMSINKFLKNAVNECKVRGLSDSEYSLTKRLTTRLSTEAERSFIGGRYLMPLALRYDNQDVSKYTVDKTCIFFSFPYLCLDTVDLRKYYEKGYVDHPPRTLLQSRYRLNKTKDRDRLQCVRWLKGPKLESRVLASELDKKRLSKKKVQELFYVPQLWGLIVGLDTLITSGCSDKQTFCGSDIHIKPGKARVSGKKLSLVRILFYHNLELEELIYPLHQCDSCFGLVNKKQQILEYLEEETLPSSNGKPRNATAQKDNKQRIIELLEAELLPKSSTEPKIGPVPKDKAKPLEHHFWRDEDGLQITFDNWGSILEESSDKEMLSIRMQVETPKIAIDAPPEDTNSDTKKASSHSGSTKSQNTQPALNTPAFLAWPMQDEFGEKETLPVEKRVSKFLRAIYLGLPVPNVMTVKERTKRPQAVSEKRAQARHTVTVSQTTFAELQEQIKVSSVKEIGQELLDKSKELMLLFVPSSLGVDFGSNATRVFWGAISEILQEAGREAQFEPHLRKFMGTLDQIIARAMSLHRGVHCLRSMKVPGNSEWRDEDAMADGAVLLSAVVDALGSIFLLFIEAVRYVKSKAGEKKAGLMAAPFKVSDHANDTLASLDKARDQLIREADGRDRNDTIGPVLTPEAISIAVMERLVSGVFRSGTVDIIGLYEECLEYLTLQVKYEASRRLLQKINEFSEEVAIVNDVLKQQNNVLLKFRSCLDPESFRAPSLARKLRFGYECKGIDKILIAIKEQLRAYAELRDRAKQLSKENVELVETLQDDNSKAIFIFTMVTILFLPLSFVAGFFGMNVVGISGTTSGVGHFWEIALPLTAGIIGLCAVVAIKGEDTYFASARIWRWAKGLFSDRL